MMNEQQFKEIGKAAYKKANKMLGGEIPLNIADFTNDELKTFLLTLDGLGRGFKTKVLDEFIERVSDKARDVMMPPM